MSDRFIQIADEQDLVAWRYKDPSTNQVWDSEFDLRVVPDEIQRQFRKKHTTREWVRGQRVENINPAWIDDCLDYAITGWRNVQRKGVDLPCTREWKLRLPDGVKAEIIRLCVGQELGNMLEPEPGSAAEQAQASSRPHPSSTTTLRG